MRSNRHVQLCCQDEDWDLGLAPPPPRVRVHMRIYIAAVFIQNLKGRREKEEEGE